MTKSLQQGTVVLSHAGIQGSILFFCMKCIQIKHSVDSKCSELLATYSTAESSELGFQYRQNKRDKGKREVCKISRGHRNPFEYLHLNGKYAELGEGQKWMNAGSRGSD